MTTETMASQTNWAAEELGIGIAAEHFDPDGLVVSHADADDLIAGLRAKDPGAPEQHLAAALEYAAEALARRLDEIREVWSELEAVITQIEEAAWRLKPEE